MLDIDTDPNTPIPEPKHHGLFAHPVLALSAAIVLLIGSGVLIVDRRAQKLPTSQSRGWDNINSLISGQYSPQQPSPSGTQEVPVYLQKDDADYRIPSLTAENEIEGEAVDSLDFNSLLSILQRSSPTNIRTTLPSGSTIDLSYELIPPGLVSSSSEPKGLSSDQQVLYEYANSVGSYIQSFEQQNANQTQVLKDQLEDSSDPNKNEAVQRLGRAMQALGKNLQGIQEVPETVAAEHEALAASYIEMGKNLQLVPEAKGTESLLQAINTYNASANAFVGNFVALVDIFNSNEIVFSASEPGSVFAFSGMGGQ